MSSEDEVLGQDIDFIFENIVGGNSYWQWGTVLTLWPIAMVSGFPWLLHLFTSYEPKHRCFIPNCDTKSESGVGFNATYLEFALPKSYNSTELLKVDEEFDPCRMNKVVIESSCSQASFNVTDVVNCESYVYDDSVFQETLTSQLNLVS